MINSVVVENSLPFTVNIDEVFTTEVIVDPSNNLDVYIENPNTPANVDIASIGIQGPRGYSVLSGQGVPDILDGVNNDLYIDLSVGYLYKKISNEWEFQIAITPQRETINIDSTIINNKEIELPIPPRLQLLSISFIGGIEQPNDDSSFYISGNKIKWDGVSPTTGTNYSFQNLLEVGDVMIVNY